MFGRSSHMLNMMRSHLYPKKFLSTSSGDKRALQEAARVIIALTERQFTKVLHVYPNWDFTEHFNEVCAFSCHSAV